MEHREQIRCRVAACREAQDDGREWSFYLINDGDAPIDEAVLQQVGHEWGNYGTSKDVDVHINDLAPGAHSLLWRDDDEEMRIWLTLRVSIRKHEAHLQFEFPLLYKKKNKLLPVDGLGKPGWPAVGYPLDG